MSFMLIGFFVYAIISIVMRYNAAKHGKEMDRIIEKYLREHENNG